ncbi:MAG: PHP domain-containing protein [Candidatus Peribacteraceae bacterium]|nr:PHP domain-containing protein [Candidatus Peribacteraceae bacterium]
MEKSIKLDLHIHSKFSKDGTMTPEQIISIAKNVGLDGIAVTDHNTIKGGIETAKICDDNFIVIVGSEIMTTHGEIIGLGLTEDVQDGLTPLETCKLIKKQGALVVVPHPFDKFRKGVGSELEKIVEHVDAIETFNSRTMMTKFNKKADEFSEKYNVPRIASSDSHFPDEIGSSYTILNCELDVKSILNEIKSGKTEISCRKTGIKPHWKTFKGNVKRKF